ncbi:MAG: efflux transporter outer membrane subunit [Pseudomonadota bacterium]
MKNQPDTLLSSLSVGLAILILLLLNGCAVQSTGKDSSSVVTDLPAQWSEQTASANSINPTWWRDFASAELDKLIAQGLQNNPDMGIATERIVQAEAQARIAGASLFPVLSGSAGATHRETRGGNTANADAASNSSSGTNGGNSSNSSNSISLGLSASYEFDFWGKNAAGVRAASSQQQASQFDRDSLRLTLIAGIASGYFQILAVRERLLVARDNLAIARRVLHVVEARVRYGAAAQLDLTRQRSTVLNQEAAIPPLQLQEQQGLYALAILLGQVPPGFQVAGDKLQQLQLPAIAAGIPASLLHSRPDLASAETQLAVANANIDAARAALFPSISLSSSLGLASDSLRGLVNAPLTSFNLTAGLVQAIFDGGRLRGQVSIAESRQRELLLFYRKAVLTSLADVNSALAASSRSQTLEALLQSGLQESELALRLSEVRYRAGADDLLVLLDAQRSLYQAQDQITQIRLSRLQAQLGLYKALGGGWTKA